MNHDKIQPGDLFYAHDFMSEGYQLVLQVDEKKDIIDVFSSRAGKVERYRSTWFRGCKKACGSQ